MHLQSGDLMEQVAISLKIVVLQSVSYISNTGEGHHTQLLNIITILSGSVF